MDEKKKFSVLYWSLRDNHPSTIIVNASTAEGASAATLQLDDCKFVLGVEEVQAGPEHPHG